MRCLFYPLRCAECFLQNANNVWPWLKDTHCINLENTNVYVPTSLNYNEQALITHVYNIYRTYLCACVGHKTFALLAKQNAEIVGLPYRPFVKCCLQHQRYINKLTGFNEFGRNGIIFKLAALYHHRIISFSQLRSFISFAYKMISCS